MFDLLAFDADDTLWENESLYATAQEKLRRLLASYAPAAQVDDVLHATEMRNLALYGYGIKGFTLSMVETALEVSGGRVSADEIGQIVGFGKAMIQADIRLLPHVAETIPRLAETHRLMIITKGDLLDQQRKVARSGIARHFRHVEIVSEKDREGYAALLARHGVAPARFLMVGNSLRSDVLPVVALGGQAVYIPHAITWAHEEADPPAQGADGYYTLDHIGLLPDLIAEIEGNPPDQPGKGGSTLS